MQDELKEAEDRWDAQEAQQGGPKATSGGIDAAFTQQDAGLGVEAQSVLEVISCSNGFPQVVIGEPPPKQSYVEAIQFSIESALRIRTTPFLIDYAFVHDYAYHYDCYSHYDYRDYHHYHYHYD